MTTDLHQRAAEAVAELIDTAESYERRFRGDGTKARKLAALITELSKEINRRHR